MASMFGIGGSAANTDRDHTLQSWGDLQALFNYGSKHGKQEVAAGQDQTATGAKNLADSMDYWKKLAGGDRGAMSQVLAPQISAIQGQTAARTASNNQFSNRSGGTNAANQYATDAATKAIQSLFDTIGPEAAKEFSQLSGIQEQLGQGQEGQGANLLGMAKSSAADIAGTSIDAYKTDEEIKQAQQKAITQALLSLPEAFVGGVKPPTGGV